MSFVLDAQPLAIKMAHALWHSSVLTVDCGRYNLGNGTFLSLLIKDITTLAYSVAYDLSIKLLVVILPCL